VPRRRQVLHSGFVSSQRTLRFLHSKQPAERFGIGSGGRDQAPRRNDGVPLGVEGTVVNSALDGVSRDQTDHLLVMSTCMARGERPK
jgi:hypothetical protein